MKVTFIVHGKLSGQAQLREKLTRALPEGYTAEFHLTQRAHHAGELTTRALTDGADFAIAVGGDGLLNEVANGYVKCTDVIKKHAAIGVFPKGTGNDFCKTIGIKADVGQLNIGFQLNRYKYDLGFFGGTYTESYSWFVIEPQVKYYLLDVAPHGLYVGGYYIVAARSGGAQMGIGPNVGYQYFLLDDRLALDANIGMGIGFLVGDGVSSGVGFDMPFQVGAGWAF